MESNIGGSRLYFSDGTMDLNGPDEETVENSQSIVDPKSLPWGPWAMHMTIQAGIKTLGVCDYLGESLASFLGITTPKYQFEINEYHRQLKEDEEELRQRDAEIGNWATEKITDHVTFQPLSSNQDRVELGKF